jgi:hypothetical protein
MSQDLTNIHSLTPLAGHLPSPSRGLENGKYALVGGASPAPLWPSLGEKEWTSFGENRWTSFGENRWTSLGENHWTTMGENHWTSIARKMTSQ